MPTSKPTLCPLALLSDAAAAHLEPWKACGLAGLVFHAHDERLTRLLLGEGDDELAEGLDHPRDASNWLWSTAMAGAIDELEVDPELAAQAATAVVDQAVWLYRERGREGGCCLKLGADTQLTNLPPLKFSRTDS